MAAPPSADTTTRGPSATGAESPELPGLTPTQQPTDAGSTAADSPLRRSKLGLALAGGGFRASLFHLGVLRRLAELDVLRHVEVLSTVSGGSIIGALYALLLKRELEASPDGRLTRQQYIDLVRDVDRILVRGIRKNLRLLLFLNPFGILRVMLTEHSLGRRMARIYERYLYAEAVDGLKGLTQPPWWQRPFRPGRILLREIRPHPGGRKPAGGLEAYNAEQTRAGGSAITNLVVNATSLNSGGRFFFSSAEVGDWYLGSFRHSENEELLARKELLHELSKEEVERRASAAERAASGTVEGDAAAAIPGARDPRLTLSLAHWWRELSERRRAAGAGRRIEMGELTLPEPWLEDFERAGVEPPPVAALAEADLGLLRQLKAPAWFLRDGARRDYYGAPVSGGRTEDGHWDALIEEAKRIDGSLGATLAACRRHGGRPSELALDLILEMYWLRSAENVSPRMDRDWAKLSLGDAVGASACFPPVFPPFVLLGVYDDTVASRLALSDGGVYDNMGITALLDERCNCIIASDTSGVFDTQRKPSTGRLGMTARITSVLTGAIAGIQRGGLRERRRTSRAIEQALPPADRRDPGQRALDRFNQANELRELAFFHINSPPITPAPTAREPASTGAENGGPGSDAGRGSPVLHLSIDRDRVAALRTDLDGFGDVEVAALVNHGYDTADRYVREYLKAYHRPEWDDAWAPVAPKPLPDPARVDRVLDVGRKRLFRSLALGAPVSWAFSVAVFAAFIAGTWRVEFAVADTIRASAAGVAGLAVRALGGVAPGITDRLLDVPFALGRTVLLLAVVLGLPLALGLNPVEIVRRRSVSWGRKLAFAAKWGRSFAGNLLWFIGLLPLVVAGLSFALSGIAYLFFFRPFMARTRFRG